MASEPREQWAPLVGRLILSCGDVELRLLQLHWNLNIGGAHDPDLKNQGMGEKAKAALQDVEKKTTIKPELKRRLVRMLNRTIKLAHSRNLVAHNPLYMDVYADVQGNFVLVPSIRSLRNSEKHVSIEELAAVVEEARELEAELSVAAGEVGEAACHEAPVDNGVH